MGSKSRTNSSQRWLERQRSDHFVQKARQEGYRSRSAYKLLEVQEKDRILLPGMTVVDLGAAPGGWSQVAAEKVGRTGKVVALDILPMDSINGVDIVQGDFQKMEVLEELIAVLGDRKVELVISDMAPNLSGIPAMDHARAMHLAEIALEFTERVLVPNGTFFIKIFQGSDSQHYATQLKKQFKQVIVRKPKASRAESREMYLLAKGYNPLESIMGDEEDIRCLRG